MNSHRLDELCGLITDGTHYTPPPTAVGIPYLTVKDIGDVGLDFEHCGHVSQDDYELARQSNCTPIRGDVLFSKDGTVGKVCVVDTDSPFVVLSSIAILRARQERISPEYLAFALRSESAIAQTASKKSGSALRRVILKDLKSLTIPVPSIDAQKVAVNLLCRAESIVRMRREAEARTKRIASALFFGMFGDPMTSGARWATCALGGLLSQPIRNGISPSRKGTHAGRVLTLSAITRGRFNANAVKDASFARALMPSDEVRMADFLVCRGNGNLELVGSGCLPTSDMPGVAFPDTSIALRPDPDRLHPVYLQELWRTRYIRAEIERIAKTTNGTYKINQTGLGTIRVPVPPIESQRRFAALAQRLLAMEQQQAIATSHAEQALQSLLAGTFAY